MLEKMRPSHDTGNATKRVEINPMMPASKDGGVQTN